jgi:hypothetical protein
MWRWAATPEDQLLADASAALPPAAAIPEPVATAPAPAPEAGEPKVEVRRHDAGPGQR